MEFLHLSVIVAMATAGLLTFGCIRYYGEYDVVSTCPCSEAQFCEIIKDTTRKEIYVFSLYPKNDDWLGYNWDKVTTVVMVGYMDMKLVCHAHKNGARAVYIASVKTDVLTDPNARQKWTAQQVQFVKDNYLDGLNFDYEEAILANQTALRQGYVDLVAETNKALKAYNPYLQVSVDVAWSPDCIDSRCYDYVGLARASDFMFVMAYDEQSQIYGKCVAGANSGYLRTMSGLRRYLSLGVAADRLVLGVPWYGYNYECLSISKGNICSIKEIPFRGVNCSDAAGKQINYSATLRLIKQSKYGRQFDKNTMSPYYSYMDQKTKSMHLVWYDDPESLGYKYRLAVDLNLRGVGMWNAECVNYTSQLPEDIQSVKSMWDAFPDYKSHGLNSFWS